MRTQQQHNYIPLVRRTERSLTPTRGGRRLGYSPRLLQHATLAPQKKGLRHWNCRVGAVKTCYLFHFRGTPSAPARSPTSDLASSWMVSALERPPHQSG